MKKNVVLPLILLLVVSCQARFNGKNEESFNSSREKIEKELTQDEKVKLEKALWVVAIEAVRLKWEESEKYDGKSFNDISLDMVDGLSYAATVELAEDILKRRTKKEADKLTEEIERLSQQKAEFENIQKRLNLFKVSFVSISLEDFIGEMVPELEVDYQYIGVAKLVGAKAIQFEVKRKSTGEVIADITYEYGNDKSVMEKGELISQQLVLRQSNEQNPKLWSAIKKHAIENPNLSDYDLELNVYVVSLFLNGEKVEMPKMNMEELKAEIQSKKEELEELKVVKGTLDELELTGE